MSLGTIPTAKVVLLGESGAGKTSLALRFVKNEFHPYTESTIGASFLTKTISTSPKPSDNDDDNDNIKPSAYIQLHLWDTAGEEKYHSITPMYYRGSEAAILVYDICSEVSFDAIQRWVSDLERCGPADLLMVVCGNKCDLDCRMVSQEKAEKYALAIGAVYFETSARDGVNVDVLFRMVGKSVRDRILGCEEDVDVVGDGGTVDLGVALDRQWYCC